jgi:hypothetical protein
MSKFWENVASFLKLKGLSVQNRAPSGVPGNSLFDADLEHHQHWASNELRSAILGEGEKRAVPTAANIMNCPMREIGRRPSATSATSPSAAREMDQYLKGGGIYHDDK